MKTRLDRCAIVVASIVYAACSDAHPTDSTDDMQGNAPVGFNVSNVVTAGTLGARGVAAQSSSGSAYVSAAPNTFLGEGDRVLIRNETSRAPATTVSLIDGGFDPVSIDGQEGDDVSVSLFKGSELLSISYVRIPPRRPPRVVRTIPEKGRVDVALNTVVEVVFSEPIDPSTIAQSLRLLRNGNPVTGLVRLSASGLIAEFSPEGLLESGTSYTLSLTQGVRDLDGDQLSEPALIDFRTGTTPPLKLDGVLAFERDDIYTIKADGSGLIRLTNLPSSNFQPAWSPDGKRIAFVNAAYVGTREEPDVFLTDVFITDADGSNVIQLTRDGNIGKALPTWSPDGKRIAFVRGVGFLDSDIYIMDADGSNVTQLTQGGTAGCPRWSPDGKRIAFVRGPYDGEKDIYIMDAGGSNVIQLTLGGAVRGVECPAWSPDGRTVLFENGFSAFSSRLFTASTEGSSQEIREFPLPYPDQKDQKTAYQRPSWSPDGTRVAFVECDYSSRAPDRCSLATANADASGYRRLVGEYYIAEPTWSPDGTTIVYGALSACLGLCTPQFISYVTLDGRKGLIANNANSPSWRPSPR